eukprot:snap_masked-scaffold_87-processed-gene-0.18-mRNA-1 protein AED:1.00 eAED:1.00 QI:0/-1/0/0/-1/1/1/0/76
MSVILKTKSNINAYVSYSSLPQTKVAAANTETSFPLLSDVAYVLQNSEECLVELSCGPFVELRTAAWLVMRGENIV